MPGQIEIARNLQLHPNGATVVTVTMATVPDATQPPGAGNPPSAPASLCTITKGPDGAMPLGWNALPALSAFPAAALIA